MAAKIKAAWWLALVCAFLAGVCAYPMVDQVWYAVSSHTYNGTQMYVGRTTLMESRSISAQSIPTFKTGPANLANLGSLAMSSRVIMNAVQTLSDLGVESTPEKVLKNITVAPVKDTNILAIEVTLPDAKEAKVAADVMASELKKEYARVYAQPGKNNEVALKIIDPAYVIPAHRPNPARLLLALLFSPIGGPTVGIIIGLLLGLSFAKLFSCRKQSNQLQGV